MKLHRYNPLSLKNLGLASGIALVVVLALPIPALLLSTSPIDLRAGVHHPLFAPALWLSLRTTFISLVLTIIGGTPLAWWLATSPSRLARIVALVVDLPIVIPPAVVGVALLQTFGRQGLFGPVLTAVDISIPFTQTAVVLAQVVVSAPFFVQASVNAFRRVEPDLMIVARTLGASPTGAFVRIALPMALPGLVTGASLAWARSLGEFGATLLFAGNMTGTTQTMPLAIFSVLESNVRIALVFSIVLTALGAMLLLALRLIKPAWTWSQALTLTTPVEPNGELQ